MDRTKRLEEIQQVLKRTLFLNFLVCIIKITLGIFTGILAIAADGIHSLGDSLSNVAGMFAVRFARREPDERYSYGYDKFEAIATLIIAGIISVTFFELVKAGIEKIIHPQMMGLHPITLIVMLVSIGINFFVVWYEGGAGRRLKSDLLIADSSETKSDIFISFAVLISVYFIGQGVLWLDGVITLIIALFILRIIIGIVRTTTKVLCDAQVISPESIIESVMTVPEVRFCHAVRTRGHESGFYADLHIGVDCSMSVEKAHDEISHKVKETIKKSFPGMKAAHIHIEPDNVAGRERQNSVFRTSDPYGIKK